MGRGSEFLYGNLSGKGYFLCPLLRSLYYDNSEENLFGLYAQFRQFIWLAVLLGAASGGIGKGGLKVKEKVLILSVLGLMLYLRYLKPSKILIYLCAFVYCAVCCWIQES